MDLIGILVQLSQCKQGDRHRMDFRRFLLSSGAIATLTTSITTYAAYPDIVEPPAPMEKTAGFYFGGEFGWGMAQLGDVTRVEEEVIEGGVLVNSLTAGDTTRFGSGSQTGLTGRANLGYNINRFIAVELGGNAWEQATYSWRTYDVSGPQIARAGGDQLSYNIDLLAKLSYPFENGFLVYVKGGPAYVWSRSDINNSLRDFAPLTLRAAERSTKAFRPEAAAGAGYHVNENWSIHLQYLYLWGQKSDLLKSDYIPDLQQVTVGVQYNFV